MAGNQSIRIEGLNKLEALARDLKQAGNRQVLRRDLRRGLVRAVNPMERAVKTAIRGLPSNSKHKGKGRLRAQMARTVRHQVRLSGNSVGVRVFLNPKAMPGGKESLPSLMDSPAGWRHPVFNKDVWVRQPGRPFFDQAVKPHEDGAVRECIAIVDKIARDIER